MWRGTLTLAVGLMFMGEGMQQDLPPGVLLLSRIKRHIADQTTHQGGIAAPPQRHVLRDGAA